MRADLEAAAEMQRALLPEETRPLPGIRAAWHVEACERLGGDTLNVFALDRRRLGFFLLDVSGHGVKAAMLTVALHRVLCPYPHPGSVLVEPPRGRHGVPRVVSPRRVASRLNRLFPMDENAGQYFTIVYGVLDVPKRELCFVSAGQGAPIVIPRRGEPTEIERYDLPIGLVPHARYEGHRVRLALGSRLFFVSDGVVEAAGADGEDFGKGRLLASLRRHPTRALATTVRDLAREVREWSARGLRDDVSMLALELASR
jgi:sigma-B regulation protein RsbU (phosphoserine phosphatase)